jgi:histidinol phosphatase-like PHP family hydrolase
MQITSDWHIHSSSSCDDASMNQAEFVTDAPACGLLDFGITDHLHTPYNMPDVEASRKIYDSVCSSPRFHFGIEVSCMSQWEIDEVATGQYENPVYGLRQGGPANGALAIGLTAEDIERLGIEYVVAGTHWPMYCPIEREAVIRDYHRQNMFLATHPLVTIVSHPWWWMGAWMDSDNMYRTDPWLDDFGRIPQSMHEEFAATVREHGKVVEINLEAMLLSPQYTESFARQYLEYIAWMRDAGVVLSIGSDCHSPRYTEIRLDNAATLLESVGFKDEMFWRMPIK